jgi:hypothetical protein
MIKHFTFLLLMLSTTLFGQLDSSVTYVKDTAKYKAVYEEPFVYFYKFNGGWNLYGKWEEVDLNRLYYRVDSAGNELLDYESIWDTDTRYSYYVDTLGERELVAYTRYYGTIPAVILSTDVVEEIDGLIVYTTGGTIVIEAAVINKIIVYDIEGRPLLNIIPNKSEVVIAAFTANKFLFLKIYYNNGKYAVKKVVTSY